MVMNPSTIRKENTLNKSKESCSNIQRYQNKFYEPTTYTASFTTLPSVFVHI